MMMKKSIRRWAAAVGAAAFACLSPALISVIGAAPVQQVIPNGGVVQLTGTPHVWISAGGSLHWAGDTRALAGRNVDWNARRTLTLPELRAYPIGDPWLSAGLVKLGEPIYLAKWETGEVAPTLLHVRSIGDVELFGITGGNYGALVLDQQTWEQRYGFPTGALSKGALAGAVPTPTPVPTVSSPAPPVAPPPAPAAVPQPQQPTRPTYDPVACSQVLADYSRNGLATAAWRNLIYNTCGFYP